MRLISFLMLICCVSTAVFAQSPTAEDIAKAQQMVKQYQNDPRFQQQMRQVQQQMQKMDMKGAPAMDPGRLSSAMQLSECLTKSLSEKEMQEMGRQGEALGKQIKALCDAGKKAEAEKVAMDYGNKMKSSKEYKTMKFCAEAHKDLYNDPTMSQMRTQMQQMEGKKKGICEGIN